MYKILYTQIRFLNIKTSLNDECIISTHLLVLYLGYKVILVVISTKC